MEEDSFEYDQGLELGFVGWCGSEYFQDCYYHEFWKSKSNGSSSGAGGRGEDDLHFFAPLKIPQVSDC